MIRRPKNRPPTHPGVHLRRAMSRNSLTLVEVAELSGISTRRLNAIIEGRRAVTPDAALGLEVATEVSPGFWTNSQATWNVWNRAKGPPPGNQPGPASDS